MDREYGIYKGEQKFKHNTGYKIWRKENTWKK